MLKVLASIVFTVVVVTLVTISKSNYRSLCASQVEKTVAVMSGQTNAPDAMTKEDELELDSLIEKTREDSDAMDVAFADGDVAEGLGVLFDSEIDFYRDGDYSKNVAINAKQFGGNRLAFIDQIKTSDWMVSVANDTLLAYMYWCVAMSIFCLLMHVTQEHAAVDAMESLVVVIGLAISLMAAGAGIVLSGPWGLVATIFSAFAGLLLGLIAIMIPIGIAVGEPEAESTEAKS